MTKNNTASKGEEAKYNLCKPKGPAGSSHIKALSKAVLVVFVCLLVAPVNCVFCTYLFIALVCCLAKTKRIITQNRRGSGSTR